jgi:hypothetical protein
LTAVRLTAPAFKQAQNCSSGDKVHQLGELMVASWAHETVISKGEDRPYEPGSEQLILASVIINKDSAEMYGVFQQQFFPSKFYSYFRAAIENYMGGDRFEKESLERYEPALPQLDRRGLS